MLVLANATFDCGARFQCSRSSNLLIGSHGTLAFCTEAATVWIALPPVLFGLARPAPLQGLTVRLQVPLADCRAELKRLPKIAKNLLPVCRPPAVSRWPSSGDQRIDLFASSGVLAAARERLWRANQVIIHFCPQRLAVGMPLAGGNRLNGCLSIAGVNRSAREPRPGVPCACAQLRFLF